MDKNPDIKFAKTTGVDLPILRVYLAGRIAGNCMDKCVGWRKELRERYAKYKEVSNPCTHCARTEFKIFNKPESCPQCHGAKVIKSYESYPIAFIDPLNSGETKTCDKLGLTSHIPANLIFDKDWLSVDRADVIVANVEDYFEEGIEDLMKIDFVIPTNEKERIEKEEEQKDLQNIDYKEAFFRLQDKIKNRRENFGTICEIAWALKMQKPLILIVPEKRAYIYENHPFAKRASAIVKSVDELVEKKWLNNLYKAIAGAIY